MEKASRKAAPAERHGKASRKASRKTCTAERYGKSVMENVTYAWEGAEPTLSYSLSGTATAQTTG